VRGALIEDVRDVWQTKGFTAHVMRLFSALVAVVTEDEGLGE